MNVLSLPAIDKSKLIVLLLLPFLCYFQTIGFDYALDDALYISDNQFTSQGLAGIEKHFSNEALTGFYGEQKNILTGGRYRPLALVTYSIENEFFGFAPGVSHFINALLYSFLCALLFFLFIVLGYRSASWKDPLFFGLILFAIHPIHTEVVANIKGRDQILGFILILFTSYYFHQFLKSKNYYLPLGLSVLCFFLALLSKESSITFLVPIPLLFYFLKGFELRKIAIGGGALLGSALLWFVIRSAVIEGFQSVESDTLLNDPFLGAALLNKLSTLFYTWLIYIKLLFVPHPLTYDYYPFHIPIVGFANSWVIVSVVVHLALIAFAVIGFIKRQFYAYLILFYASTFSISSNLFFNIGTFMNERFMFEPSLAFCLFVAFLTTKLLQDKAVYVLVGMTLIFSVLTFNRTKVWENNYTLFTTDVKTSSNSAKGLMAAGGIMLDNAKTLSDFTARKDELNQAIAYLKKSIELLPSELNNYRLLGNALIEKDGVSSAALSAYREVLKRASNDAIILGNIKILMTSPNFSMKDRLATAAFFSTDLNEEGWYHFLAAKLYKDAKPNSDQVLSHLSKAIEIDADNTEYKQALGFEYGQRRMYEESNAMLLELVVNELVNQDIITAIVANFEALENSEKADEYRKYLKR